MDQQEAGNVSFIVISRTNIHFLESLCIICDTLLLFCCNNVRAVGALFIRDNFNHESKEIALEMIHNIRGAFNELLADIEWMDDETRAVAKEKADAMNERIGYPEILTNRTELEKEYVNVNISS